MIPIPIPHTSSLVASIRFTTLTGHQGVVDSDGGGVNVRVTVSLIREVSKKKQVCVCELDTLLHTPAADSDSTHTSP